MPLFRKEWEGGSDEASQKTCLYHCLSAFGEKAGVRCTFPALRPRMILPEGALHIFLAKGKHSFPTSNRPCFHVILRNRPVAALASFFFALGC
jgi:hypothetical protein